MIDRLLGFDLAGRDDPGLLRGTLWGLLAAACDLVPYVVLLLVFSLVLGEGGSVAILPVFGALLLSFLGAWAFKARALLDSFSATYGLVADMRLATADRLGRMSLGSVARYRGATLADLFTDRFTLYQDIVTHMWWQVSATVGFPAMLWLLLLIVDWRLGLAMAAFAPVVALIVPWSFRLLDRATDKVIPARDEVANRIVEIAEGAKEIRVLDPSGSRIRATALAIADLEKKSLATELAPAPAILAFGFVWSVALAAIICLGALLWTRDAIDVFGLVAGMVLAARLSAALADLGVFLIEYRFARRALASIREFAQELPQTVADRPATPSGTAIEIDGVSFSHADEVTLSQVSLDIPEGRMTAIVGPSGAGKSTLVSLIGRLWDVDRGAVRIGGVDVRDMTPETLNAIVSMVLQEVSLFELSAEDNIRLGKPDATRSQVEAAARAARIHDRILELPEGYDTILTGGGAQLSGGERQRLAIARALLKDAPILILDEATASVDLDNERLIQEALENLTARRTVIVIAHRLWTVRDADQIAVLDQGKLEQVATHGALLEECPVYQRLWHSQRDAEGWRLGG